MAPYSWTIDDSTRTVFVRGYGDGITEDTLELIAELGAELRARPGYDFVYDSTALRIASSPADMMRVAKAMFEEGGMRFRRFAIVVPPSRVALARIFAALAHPFGVTANVFADEVTAREWLAERRERASLDAHPIAEPPPAAPPQTPPASPEAPEIDPEP